MNYSLKAAQQFVGKRVIVSLRHVHPDGTHTYSGFWGVVDAAYTDGLRLAIEGGLDESHWAIPPDLDAFQLATHERYELGDDGIVVTDVDYEMYWSVADSLEDLEKRERH